MNPKFIIATNRNQGDTKKVLCVCTAGILRSASISTVLTQEYGYNTRVVGCDPNALCHIEWQHVAWADEIVCANEEHKEYILERFNDYLGDGEDRNKIIVLGIEDIFKYMEPDLVHLINIRYDNAK